MILTANENSVNLEQGRSLSLSVRSGPVERESLKQMTSFRYTAPDEIELTHNNQVIGIVTITEAEQAYEPHVEWNEKATFRGIYNCYMMVLSHLRQTKHVIIIAFENYAKFFDGLVKRNIIRKIGVMEDFYLDGNLTSIHTYQARKSWAQQQLQ